METQWFSISKVLLAKLSNESVNSTVNFLGFVLWILVVTFIKNQFQSFTIYLDGF